MTEITKPDAAEVFNRGALRMTVTQLRARQPKLALLVQNQMGQPINPQQSGKPNPKDDFRIEVEPLDVRKIVESLAEHGRNPNIDAGTAILLKALIGDWLNYANYLIQQQPPADVQ